MNSITSMKRFLTPILARIRRVILGAKIESTDDATPLQQMKVQTLGRAVYDKVEVFGQFGFTSRPPNGSDAIIVERNGKYIVIAVGDRQHRIRNIESGDSVVYDVRGQTIILNKSGIMTTDVFDNTITTDANGVKIDDKNNNHIVMNAAGTSVTDKFGNSISTSSKGVTINGVVITKTGAVTTPSTITSGGLIKSGGDVQSSTGKTLDTHTHGVPAANGIVSGPVPNTTPPTA